MSERLSGRRGQALRRLVLDTYGTTCHLCGHDCTQDFTVDHILPVSAGGGNDLANLRPAHGKKTATCPGNYGRGARLITPTRNRSRTW